jgi:hypothetical protein
MKKLSEDTRFLRWVEALWLLGASLLVLAIYGNVLHGDFLFDDLRLIPGNPAVRLTELSLDGLLRVARGTRPVAMLSLALNYYFHQYDVFGYHLVNVVIHILTGWCLYFFAKTTLVVAQVTRAKKEAMFVALTAATLWLVHPVQTQSVSYIIQRMNSLAGLFFVLAMLCYVQGRVRLGWQRALLFVGCGLAGILAVGSKEMAITLPFFVILYEWYFFQELSAAWLRKALVVLGAGLAAVGVFLFFFPQFMPLGIIQKGYSLYPFTMEQRLYTELRVVVHYLSLLVFPHPSRLNLDYDFPLSLSLVEPWTTGAAALLLGALFVAALYLARGHRLLSFCLLWFLGNLVIESTIIPLDLVMEHRLYVPSMMLIVAMVLVASRLLRRPLIRAVGLAVLVVLLGVWTHERNKVWQSPLALMVDTADKSPDKARPAYNVACEYAKQGMAAEAVGWLRKSVALEGFNRWDLIKYDRDLQKIRDSQEFRLFYVEKVPAELQ